jgi:hypothetical protein
MYCKFSTSVLVATSANAKVIIFFVWGHFELMTDATNTKTAIG